MNAYLFNGLGQGYKEAEHGPDNQIDCLVWVPENSDDKNELDEYQQKETSNSNPNAPNLIEKETSTPKDSPFLLLPKLFC